MGGDRPYLERIRRAVCDEGIAMKAAYKKGLCGYFNTMTGYLFITLFLLAAGLFFSLDNIFGQNAKLSALLDGMRYSAPVIVVILTMGLWAKERKEKTDPMLPTAPVSVKAVVAGKFFSAYTVFIAAVAFSLIYPVVLALLGTPAWGEIMAGYLGLALLGAVLIALGMFISSLVKRPVAAAAWTLGIVLCLWLAETAIPQVASGQIGAVLGQAMPAYYYGYFQSGFLSLPAFVYFISLIFLFLFLTCWTIGRQRRTKGSRAAKGWKNHGCSVAALVTAAVAVLLVNVGTAVLDQRFDLCADATDQQYTVLTDDTKDLLARLDQPIYLYYTGKAGQEDILVAGLLRRYAADSPGVHYQVIDTDADAQFLQRYNAPAQAVVVSDAARGYAPGRYQVIPVQELYSTSASSAGTNGKAAQYFDGERKITSAIDDIVTGQTKKAVFLEGNGEKMPCDTLLGDLRLLYYEYGFETAGSPLDPLLDTLIVISPRTDLPDDAYANIEAFLKAGGRAIFFMDSMSVDEATGEAEFLTEDLNRFDALLADYGVSVNRDVIVGVDPSKTYRSRISLIPALSGNSAVALTMTRGSLAPVLSYASSVNLPQAAEGSVTPVLETDGACYAKTIGGGLATLDREPGDRTGVFTIGAWIQKDGAVIALYTASSFVVSEESYGYRSNKTLFLSTLSELNQKTNSISIPAKTVYSAADPAYRLHIVSAAQKIGYTVAVAGIVPAAVLIFGVARRLRRR